MGGFFNLEGGIMGALSKLGDIMLASVLWFVFSLPLVTIGASTTALYYTSVKAIRCGRSYVWRSFWKSFKENFLPATMLWLLMVIACIVLRVNIWYTYQIGSAAGLLLRGVYVLMAVIFALTGMYIFPVLSRFFMGKWQILKLSFFMGIKHLPFSVCIVAIVAAAVFMVYLMPPFIFVMPAGAALFVSVPMERILRKYMPESEDKNADQWYLE